MPTAKRKTDQEVITDLREQLKRHQTLEKTLMDGNRRLKETMDETRDKNLDLRREKEHLVMKLDRQEETVGKMALQIERLLGYLEGMKDLKAGSLAFVDGVVELKPGTNQAVANGANRNYERK